MKTTLLLVLLAAPAAAQCPPATLSPSDAQAGEQLGRSAAIDGDVAVLGAWKYDRPGGPAFNENGGAVVFERQAGAWNAVARLVHFPTANQGDFLAHAGLSVAVSGERVLVGAPSYSVGQNETGAVFAWKRTASGWVEEPMLAGPDTTFAFGRGLALQGEEALVGDQHGHPPTGGNVANPGRLWRFTRDASGWTFDGSLWAGDMSANARFGEAVAVDGDRLLVGAPAADDSVADCGAAYVFERNGASWVQVAKLLAPVPVSGEEFGAAVALRGDVAVVGASLADAPGGLADSGAVHVFRRVNGAWIATALAWGERAGAQLGCSVAVSATKVLAGARRDALVATDAGAAVVWDLVGGALAQRRDLVSPHASTGDQFGVAAALSEDAALVGAFGEAPAGAGYVFRDGGTDADGDGVPDACETFTGTALCFGDGSGTACPCSNSSATAERAGCRNSFGRGGALTAEGLASVSADSVVLTSAWMPPNVPALFFQGETLVGAGSGALFGDGLRCAGGPTRRLGKPFGDANGVARFGAGVAGTSLVSVAGQIPAPGGTRVYQVWYRNAAAFCTASTFNLTNALVLTWIA